MFNDFMDLLSFLLLRFMFKDSIDFVFVVDIGVVVDDDEQDLDFVNKLDILQIKTEKKKLKLKFCIQDFTFQLLLKIEVKSSTILKNTKNEVVRDQTHDQCHFSP